MPWLPFLLGLVMMASLTLYVLLGGADYGGGVWDLFARGPRAERQRETIAEAIGPIWEANHVWLILVVVILFTAFPTAYALISTALHIPLVLILIGIVMRGAAFSFRSYEEGPRVRDRWGRVFAIASLLTPVLLGVVVGAISSGAIRKDPAGAGLAYFFTWLTPFAFSVGIFAVVLFAFLAAVYLTLETTDAELREDFRRRAIISEIASGGLALVVFLLAGEGAPDIQERLATSWWSWPLQVGTAAAAIGALWALGTRRFSLARACAAAQVTLILWGWGLAQYPYLIRPDVSIYNAAAPAVTLRLLLWALAGGALLLFPSYWYLLRVFKSHMSSRG